MKRRIAILGATGSVGSSALDLIERDRDRFEVVAVTASTQSGKLADIALRTEARLAVVADEAAYRDLKARLSGSGCEPAAGREALIAAGAVDCDLVVAAIVGCAGLEPVMAAVGAGRVVALANKEALVTAGALMIDAARRSGATILPVDSEHNAIFQCLAGNSIATVSRLILTASGGPFRDWTAERIAVATPAEAVAHPNWSMGAKISVDSATLMNKGLELIEAHHLFGLPDDRLDVLLHPQSIVHSLVEYIDGSVLAQLGSPDMRIPIAFALAWPERMPTPAERLNLASCGRLDFAQPDMTRFPCLNLARSALVAGGAAPIVLNAANEVAVANFLDGRIGFTDIAATVDRALSKGVYAAPRSIDDVLEIDRVTRAQTQTKAAANYSQ